MTYSETHICKMDKLVLAIIIFFLSNVDVVARTSDYLSFSAVGGEVEILMKPSGYYPDKLDDLVLETSIDKEVWDNVVTFYSKVHEEQLLVKLRDGETVYVRRHGKKTKALSKAYSYWKFRMKGEGKVYASGNIMSLIDANCESSKVGKYCFNSLFHGCDNLIKAPDLPAVKLSKYCCNDMFANCKNLQDAPELPAIELARGCYAEMFSDCKSLVKAPSLPATKLHKRCYSFMFSGCESLISAPKLRAQKMKPNCYFSMFSFCANLVNVPELPAMKLARRCYAEMFLGCESIVNAPELPATRMKPCCYQTMFMGCSSLLSVPKMHNKKDAFWFDKDMLRDCPMIVGQGTVNEALKESVIIP